jgi:hypothetical protein
MLDHHTPDIEAKRHPAEITASGPSGRSARAFGGLVAAWHAASKAAASVAFRSATGRRRNWAAILVCARLPVQPSSSGRYCRTEGLPTAALSSIQK